jgi:monofunctional biosynthetic peptidoglycan transglycosylase
MKALGRWLAVLLCAALALQLFFIARIALAAWWDPQSTSFQRSEMWRIWQQSAQQRHWQQQWVDYPRISPHLKRAVLTAEDDGFVDHDGVQWDAIERAWERNQQALERAQRSQRLSAKPVPIYGGSTITQQLAKNLLLSGERSFLRKGQELVLAHALELFLSKERILEIYLNNVEWGQGIFGAEAAAGRKCAPGRDAAAPPLLRAEPAVALPAVAHQRHPAPHGGHAAALAPRHNHTLQRAVQPPATAARQHHHAATHLRSATHLAIQQQHLQRGQRFFVQCRQGSHPNRFQDGPALPIHRKRPTQNLGHVDGVVGPVAIRVLAVDGGHGPQRRGLGALGQPFLQGLTLHLAPHGRTQQDQVLGPQLELAVLHTGQPGGHVGRHGIAPRR